MYLILLLVFAILTNIDEQQQLFTFRFSFGLLLCFFIILIFSLNCTMVSQKLHTAWSCWNLPSLVFHSQYITPLLKGQLFFCGLSLLDSLTSNSKSKDIKFELAQWKHLLACIWPNQSSNWTFQHYHVDFQASIPLYCLLYWSQYTT